MKPFCSVNPCPIMLGSKCIIYEGAELVNTGIVNADNLETALQKIDAAINNSSGGEASWGNILPGTGVASQADLVLYLANNYYSSSNPSSFVTSMFTNSTYVPLTRTLTINGVSQDLSVDRTWTIPVGTNYTFDSGITEILGVVTLGGTLSNSATINGGGTYSINLINDDGGISINPGGLITINNINNIEFNATGEFSSLVFRSGLLGGFRVEAAGIEFIAPATTSNIPILPLAPTGLQDGQSIIWNSATLEWEYYIPGTVSTFSNGLTESASIVKLGGSLTENTVISGLYDFSIGTIGSPLNNFLVAVNGLSGGFSYINISPGSLALFETSVGGTITLNAEVIAVNANAGNLNLFSNTAINLNTIAVTGTVVSGGSLTNTNFIVGATATQTLTNKTLTSPVVNTQISGGVTNGGNITSSNFLVGATATQTLSSKTLTSPVINTQISGTVTSGGNITSTNFILGASVAQTISGAKTFLNGALLMRNVANTFSSQFTNTNTAARTYTLPNESGDIVLKTYVDTTIGGKNADTLITNPTLAQNGYAIKWNQTNNEYELSPVASLSFGTIGQIPFMNAGANDFSYASQFTWNNSTNVLEIADAFSNSAKYAATEIQGGGSIFSIYARFPSVSNPNGSSLYLYSGSGQLNDGNRPAGSVNLQGGNGREGSQGGDIFLNAGNNTLANGSGVGTGNGGRVILNSGRGFIEGSIDLKTSQINLGNLVVNQLVQIKGENGTLASNNGLDIDFLAGSAYSISGNGRGGNILIQSGQRRVAGTGLDGNITLDALTGYLILANIPTSSAGLPSGAVWSNSNVLTIVP